MMLTTTTTTMTMMITMTMRVCSCGRCTGRVVVGRVFDEQ
jgi:hypothetical protein